MDLAIALEFVVPSAGWVCFDVQHSVYSILGMNC